MTGERQQARQHGRPKSAPGSPQGGEQNQGGLLSYEKRLEPVHFHALRIVAAHYVEAFSFYVFGTNILLSTDTILFINATALVLLCINNEVLVGFHTFRSRAWARKFRQRRVGLREGHGKPYVKYKWRRQRVRYECLEALKDIFGLPLAACFKSLTATMPHTHK